jgi:hypothetical protein
MYGTKLDKIYEARVLGERELINSLGFHMSADADHWYRTARKKLNSFMEFRSSLIDAMLTPNYKFNKEIKLRAEKQSESQGFGQYCRSIWRQLLDVNPDISEQEVINILMTNARPKVVALMKPPGKIQTVDELILCGKEAEVAIQNAKKYHESMAPPPPPKPNDTTNNGERGRKRDRQCFKCGSYNHVKAQCPERQTSRSSSQSNNNVVCDRCLNAGHIAADCYSRRPRRAASQPTAARESAPLN